MPGRRGKVCVQLRLLRELAGPPTHGDHGNARLAPGVIHGRQQVGEIIRVGLNQEDACPRGHGVGPLHVERSFDGPIGIGRRKLRAAGLIDYSEARVVGLGRSELAVEDLQVGADRRVVVGVDNGNRLTGAVVRHVAGQRLDLIQPVGMADLGRRIRRLPVTAIVRTACGKAVTCTAAAESKSRDSSRSMEQIRKRGLLDMNSIGFRGQRESSELDRVVRAGLI